VATRSENGVASKVATVRDTGFSTSSMAAHVIHRSQVGAGSGSYRSVQ